MADSNLTPATLPTQIGKLGAPLESCWVQILGPTSQPDGGNYGTGRVAAFGMHDGSIFSFGDNHQLYCNDEQLDIREPGDGVYMMRVSGETLYMWCNNLDLYTLAIPELPFAEPSPVPGWDTTAMLATPLAMVIGEAGWLLTADETATRLSRWDVAGKGPLLPITLGAEPRVGRLTALALIGDTPYVADDRHIYRLEQSGEVYVAHEVFQLPSNWGGIAGMLGQQVPYNDPTPDGLPAFARYLYAMSGEGQVQLIYPDYGKFTGTGAWLPGGPVCGNLQLGLSGLLYYVNAHNTGGITTVNVLAGTLIYLDGVGVAGNHETILPNLLMSGPTPSTDVQIGVYSDAENGMQLGHIVLIQKDSPCVYDDFQYDRTICQIKDGRPEAIPICNPYQRQEGPALTLRFTPDPETDGNIIIGDIIVDPHTDKPIHIPRRK